MKRLVLSDFADPDRQSSCAASRSAQASTLEGLGLISKQLTLEVRASCFSSCRRCRSRAHRHWHAMGRSQGLVFVGLLNQVPMSPSRCGMAHRSLEDITLNLVAICGACSIRSKWTCIGLQSQHKHREGIPLDKRLCLHVTHDAVGLSAMWRSRGRRIMAVLCGSMGRCVQQGTDTHECMGTCAS